MHLNPFKKRFLYSLNYKGDKGSFKTLKRCLNRFMVRILLGKDKLKIVLNVLCLITKSYVFETK